MKTLLVIIALTRIGADATLGNSRLLGADTTLEQFETEAQCERARAALIKKYQRWRMPQPTVECVPLG